MTLLPLSILLHPEKCLCRSLCGTSCWCSHVPEVSFWCHSKWTRAFLTPHPLQYKDPSATWLCSPLLWAVPGPALPGLVFPGGENTGGLPHTCNLCFISKYTSRAPIEQQTTYPTPETERACPPRCFSQLTALSTSLWFLRCAHICPLFSVSRGHFLQALLEH